MNYKTAEELGEEIASQHKKISSSSGLWIADLLRPYILPPVEVSLGQPSTIAEETLDNPTAEDMAVRLWCLGLLTNNGIYLTGKSYSDEENDKRIRSNNELASRILARVATQLRPYLRAHSKDARMKQIQEQSIKISTLTAEIARLKEALEIAYGWMGVHCQSDAELSNCTKAKRTVGQALEEKK